MSDFPHYPEIHPGFNIPLAFDLLADIETPDSQKLREWDLSSFPFSERAFGLDLSEFRFLDKTDLEGFNSKINKGTPAESIVYFDRFSCVDVSETQIDPVGFVFELTRADVSSGGVTLLQRIATVFDSIDALDDAGNVALSFGPIDGERPCQKFVHPNPLVLLPLTFTFSIVVQERSTMESVSNNEIPFIVAGRTLPNGTNPIEPWSDMRAGYNVRWADLLQYVIAGNKIIRFFVTLKGDAGRWRLSVGGRLAGRWIIDGPGGASVDAATSPH